MLKFSVISPNATYQLNTTVSPVNEGQSSTITLTTTGVQEGQTIPYTISGVGITSADISGAPLTGNFVVSGGVASKTLNITNDALTEGAETLLVTLDNGISATLAINDTSMSPPSAVSTFTNFIGTPATIIPNLTSNNTSGYITTSSSLWSNPPYWQNYFPFSTLAPSEGGGWAPGSFITPQWLMIEMPSAATIQYVTMSFHQGQFASYDQVRDRTGLPRNFDIEVSTNGTNWTKVVEVTDFNYSSLLYASNSYARFSFTPVSAKYIRYTMKQRWAGTSGWDVGIVRAIKIS